MTKKLWWVIALALIAASVFAIQACGKGTGNGAGGVTIYGAGS